MSTKNKHATLLDLAELLSSLFGGRKFVEFNGSPLNIAEGQVILQQDRSSIKIYNAIWSGEITDLTDPSKVKQWDGTYIDLSKYTTTEQLEATYAKKSEITITSELTRMLNDYVTEAELDTKNTQLGYIKNTALNEYVLSSDLDNTIAGLNKYATKAELPSLSDYATTQALTTGLGEKLDVNTYTADKATFATVTQLNEKADATALNNYSNTNITNAAFRAASFSSDTNVLTLEPISGNNITVDLSDLKTSPIYSSVRFDNDTNELVFNDGRTDTKIALSKFLDHVETPDATDDVKGKVTLTQIDTKISTKLGDFKNNELNTLLQAKLDVSTYTTDKDNFLTADNLGAKLNEQSVVKSTSQEFIGKLNSSELNTKVEEILNTKGYLTTHQNLDHKLDKNVYDQEKAGFATTASLSNYVVKTELENSITQLNTFATVDQLAPEATNDTAGKVSLNKINEMIDAKLEAGAAGQFSRLLINELVKPKP